MLTQMGFWKSRLTLRLTLATHDVGSLDLQGKELCPSLPVLLLPSYWLECEHNGNHVGP